MTCKLPTYYTSTIIHKHIITILDKMTLNRESLGSLIILLSSIHHNWYLVYGFKSKRISYQYENTHIESVSISIIIKNFKNQEYVKIAYYIVLS